MSGEAHNDDKVAVPVSAVVTSLIASILFAAGTAVLSTLDGYKNITPNLAWIIVIMGATIALLLLAYSVLSKSTEKTIDICYTISSVVLFFCVLLFIVHITYIVSCILILYSNNSQQISMAYLESYFKASSAIAMCGCGVCIVRAFILFMRTSIVGAYKKQFEKTQNSFAASIRSISETMQSDREVLDSISSRIDNVSSDFQKIRSIKGMNSAMTSTIIPFKRSGNNEIKTYLIANKAYPEYTWMFPGGHVYFEEQDTPEGIAKERARNEAGIEAEIVDIYNSFDVRETDELLIDNMKVFFPPHYFNLFKLGDAVKCFREYGHEYHIDVVYVAEIKSINKGNYKRIDIPLPRKSLSKEEIKNACVNKITNYYSKNKVPASKQHYDLDYVIEMLYWAFNDYISYLERGKQP